jgi:hypothetical protein
VRLGPDCSLTEVTAPAYDSAVRQASSASIASSQVMG